MRDCDVKVKETKYIGIIKGIPTNFDEEMLIDCNNITHAKRIGNSLAVRVFFENAVALANALRLGIKIGMDAIDLVGKREKYLRNEFETLQNPVDSTPAKTTLDPTCDSYKNSLSSRFLSRKSPAVANAPLISSTLAQQRDPTAAKNREELLRRLEESKKKLQILKFIYAMKFSRLVQKLVAEAGPSRPSEDNSPVAGFNREAQKEVDGAHETRVEQKLIMQSGNNPIDHPRALAEAIQEATAMNPDMTVEKIEIQQQETETECIQFEENFDGFLSRRFDKREGTEITDTVESKCVNSWKPPRKVKLLARFSNSIPQSTEHEYEEISSEIKDLSNHLPMINGTSRTLCCSCRFLAVYPESFVLTLTADSDGRTGLGRAIKARKEKKMDSGGNGYRNTSSKIRMSSTWRQGFGPKRQNNSEFKSCQYCPNPCKSSS
ncbi:uncharacterized protein LOC136035044 [Artemia franciscana]|uniref:uncharacterized protein LOC136035044 n=1 Tax=Artemia franciscana TaxID=6661 RepID=UPI0032DAFBFF